MAAGIGRVALPFAKHYILLAANKVHITLLAQSVPEIFGDISKQKSPRAAAKTALKKTVKSRLVEKENSGQRNEKHSVRLLLKS